MMDKLITLSQGIEHLAAGGEELAGGRDEGRVLELGPVELPEDHEVGQTHGPLDVVNVIRVELELFPEQLPHVLRASCLDLEADGRAEAPPADVLGYRLKQVPGLVLADLEVCIARDAKRRDADDGHSGEELVEMGLDEILEQEKLERGRSRLRRGLGRQGHEPWQRSRHFQARKPPWAPSFFSDNSTASESERFDTNGNGCAGSNASGVSVGKTTFSK